MLFWSEINSRFEGKITWGHDMNKLIFYQIMMPIYAIFLLLFHSLQKFTGKWWPLTVLPDSCQQRHRLHLLAITMITVLVMIPPWFARYQLTTNRAPHSTVWFCTPGSLAGRQTFFMEPHHLSNRVHRHHPPTQPTNGAFRNAPFSGTRR